MRSTRWKPTKIQKNKQTLPKKDQTLPKGKTNPYLGGTIAPQEGTTKQGNKDRRAFP